MHCTKCGTKSNEGSDKFCRNCGKPLVSTVERDQYEITNSHGFTSFKRYWSDIPGWEHFRYSTSYKRPNGEVVDVNFDEFFGTERIDELGSLLESLEDRYKSLVEAVFDLVSHDGNGHIRFAKITVNGSKNAKATAVYRERYDARIQSDPFKKDYSKSVNGRTLTITLQLDGTVLASEVVGSRPAVVHFNDLKRRER